MKRKYIEKELLNLVLSSWYTSVTDNRNRIRRARESQGKLKSRKIKDGDPFSLQSDCIY